jgi:hypothetical protein
MSVQSAIFTWILLVIAISTVSLGQGSTKKQDKTLARSTSNCEEPEWRPILFEKFSICFPGAIEFKEKKGIDLYYWQHESDGLDIKIYTGPGAPTAGGYAQKLSSYKQDSSRIDGVPAVEWSYFDENAALPWISAIRFYINGSAKGDAISIFVQSKDAKPMFNLDISKMFASVRIRPISQTKEQWQRKVQQPTKVGRS